MKEDTKGYFESTIRVIELCQSKFMESDRNRDGKVLLQEVVKRIKQLSYLYERNRDYCKKIEEMENELNSDEKKNYKEFIPIMFEMELFCECFHFIAFRVREILKYKNKNSYIFPDLKSFEAKGVRDVRNHLIQHPERHGGLLVNSFSVDIDGPKLKPCFQEGDVPDSRDNGLWSNANEFKNNLEKIIKEAL